MAELVSPERKALTETAFPSEIATLLPVVEENRIRSTKDLDAKTRQALGQFQTPGEIADFMSSLFRASWKDLRLIDAGAGVGMLSTALINRVCRLRARPKTICVTAIEIDSALLPYLKHTLEQCHSACEKAGIQFTSQIVHGDFIEWAVETVNDDLFAAAQSFNAAIVNPPYRKINSDSRTRLLLRRAGIETSNLYAGFISLLTRLLENNGQLVAITPRSFCNGPYFKPFREQFLATMSLCRLHVFNSRAEAFQEDEVLQENIVFHAVKSAIKPAIVTISTSSRVLSERSKRIASYRDVVPPDDPDLFIHFVTEESQDQIRRQMTAFATRLDELGVSVSTGRVVDFRARKYLVATPREGTVPLIYPCHFNGGYVHWPRVDTKKPNAILDETGTQDLLVPIGIYVLVKRFTAKEERRRIVACIYDPVRIRAQRIGFENHLNYFHTNGAGLTMDFAKGLAAFLNSTLVDSYFRQFNGHTQVNATDLRSLRYPTRRQLESLGRTIGTVFPPQQELDALIVKHLL